MRSTCQKKRFLAIVTNVSWTDKTGKLLLIYVFQHIQKVVVVLQNKTSAADETAKNQCYMRLRWFLNLTYVLRKVKPLLTVCNLKHSCACKSKLMKWWTKSNLMLTLIALKSRGRKTRFSQVLGGLKFVILIIKLFWFFVMYAHVYHGKAVLNTTRIFEHLFINR